ncbi:MAG: sigma-70 family RNA polymerase sigma factor [Endomicrobia bacterium]|nr:sigma-70 family RNA polymerase sigma factor [Endomicrobiia bacterium]
MVVLNEEQLIRLAQDNNLDAFETLIEKYQKEIYNIALFKTQNISLAEEIAQETIIRIYKNIKKFKFKSSFYTWIYRITYNIMKDIIKKFKPIGEFSTEEMIISEREEIDEELHKVEVYNKIKQLISKIPHKFQFVLILADIEGKTYQEIAEILKVGIGTVKSRLFRAREMLKRLVEQERIDM